MHSGLVRKRFVCEFRFDKRSFVYLKFLERPQDRLNEITLPDDLDVTMIFSVKFHCLVDFTTVAVAIRRCFLKISNDEVINKGCKRVSTRGESPELLHKKKCIFSSAELQRA